MNNQKHGPGFILLTVMCIAFSWIIGTVMIALQSMGVIHIAGWILALPFWAPYTAFILVFTIMLLHSIFRRGTKE